jgi:hypothetical protein
VLAAVVGDDLERPEAPRGAELRHRLNEHVAVAAGCVVGALLVALRERVLHGVLEQAEHVGLGERRRVVLEQDLEGDPPDAGVGQGEGAPERRDRVAELAEREPRRGDLARVPVLALVKDAGEAAAEIGVLSPDRVRGDAALLKDEREPPIAPRGGLDEQVGGLAPRRRHGHEGERVRR